MEQLIAEGVKNQPVLSMPTQIVPMMSIHKLCCYNMTSLLFNFCAVSTLIRKKSFVSRKKTSFECRRAVVMAAVEGVRQTGLKKEERLLYRFRTHAKAALLLDQLTTN